MYGQRRAKCKTEAIIKELTEGGTQMQLVEQRRIDRHDPRGVAIDLAAFASKNLYNAALYVIRQAYIRDYTVINYNVLDTLMQPTEQYRALPAKVAQWVLKQVW